jgi:hypothetical protein
VGDRFCMRNVGCWHLYEGASGGESGQEDEYSANNVYTYM